jgi:hypothetical protein
METTPLTFTPSVFLPATTVKEDIVPTERAAAPQLGDQLKEGVAQRADPGVSITADVDFVSRVFIPLVVDPVMFGVINADEGMHRLRAEAERALGR